jgi:hypothetical protein
MTKTVETLEQAETKNTLLKNKNKPEENADPKNANI